jgi:hypothetical protein
MRAVWSFSTRPFRSYYKDLWASEKHHLLAWVLSVETARRHYPDTALVTDSNGARLLVDGLGLPFASVSTALDALPELRQEWFNLGKLYAYRSQTAPFVHIDSDVFLWRRLPPWIEKARVFGQNPERVSVDGASFYRPEACTEAIRSSGGWLAEEWSWYLASGGDEAVNCGVVGGRDVGFIAHYADLAIQTIEHPRNQAAWSLLEANVADGCLVEQFLLSACLAYHRGRTASPFCDVRVRYLFRSFPGALDERRAARLGFTHLINGAKKNPTLMERLENRVRQEHPRFYERCLACGAGGAAS